MDIVRQLNINNFKWLIKEKESNAWNGYVTIYYL